MKKIKRLIGLDKYVEKHAALQVKDILRKSKLIPIEEIRDGDIFLAGFPKSGNTWLQNLVAGILLSSSSPLLTLKLVSEIIPDIHAKKYYMRFFNSTIFKTHGLPEPQYKKVIYIVRDGRDAMVSYYNMGKNKFENFPHTMDDMVRNGSGVTPAKWHSHVKSWIKNPYDAEILFVRYEDLHLKPLEELKKISAFMGVDLEDSILEAIIKNNNISDLRNRAATFGMDNDHTWKHKPVSTFFRKGIMGGYKDEMSPELVDFFNSESENELNHFNYNA